MWLIPDFKITITFERCCKKHRPKPKPMSAQTLKEFTMSKLLVEFTCSAITDDDVKKVEVTYVATEPGQSAVTSLATLDVADPTTPPKFQASFARDTSIVLTEIEIDGNGNRSEASDPVTFIATDSFPPAKPGEMSATVVGQVP